MNPLRKILYGLVACISMLATSIAPVEEGSLQDSTVQYEVTLGQISKNEIGRIAKRPILARCVSTSFQINPLLTAFVSSPRQSPPFFILNRSLLI
ncbi:MAG: hypothetical protein ACK514_09880 [Bacteroidota bacterium]|nr:hypothetical protein [Cytophagales bacterium]MCE2958618.1 hypothetical protein [Flammeovirgaceae bacterium]MCZ8071083.1 hypothetical protein [Cytophagales bacterium]